jgi:hypothetical protein
MNEQIAASLGIASPLSAIKKVNKSIRSTINCGASIGKGV